MTRETIEKLALIYAFKNLNPQETPSGTVDLYMRVEEEMMKRYISLEHDT